MFNKRDYSHITVELLFSPLKFKPRSGSTPLVQQVLAPLAYRKMGIECVVSVPKIFSQPNIAFYEICQHVHAVASEEPFLSAYKESQKSGDQFIGYLVAVANGDGTSYVDIFNTRYSLAKGKLELLERSTT